MKKFLSKTGISILLLTGFISLTSFLPKKVAPVTICTWYANASNISFASIETPYASASTTNIVMGTNWVGGSLLGPGYTYLTTSLPGPHPAGTLSFYESGVLVRSYSVSASSLPIAFDDYFPWTGSGYYYEVYWQ